MTPPAHPHLTPAGLSTLSLRASTCTSAATHSVSSVLAPFVTRAVDVVGDAALGVATVTGTTVLAAWGGACGAVSGTARASATLARGCAALASRLWHAACSEARAQWASACAVARTVRRDLAALPSPRLAEAAAWSCSVVLVAGAMHCATRALLGAAAETSGEVAALKEQVQVTCETMRELRLRRVCVQPHPCPAACASLLAAPGCGDRGAVQHPAQLQGAPDSDRGRDDRTQVRTRAQRGRACLSYCAVP